MMYFFFICLIALSGFLYRLGGMGYPFHTRYRDLYLPLIILYLLYYFNPVTPWWVWLLTYGCIYGSMTTYCKFGEQEDVKWYNWLLTGMLYGLSVLPYVWYYSLWEGFAIRICSLMVLIPVWSLLIKNVEWEERGRGYLITATIPFLFVNL